ncbi:MAG: hypothetical protein COW02_17695 [Comamonadaceae bacterium CG12_big_fil_rev_8_21_14_0_65_59_15]|nr:MAG: hypothetical protein COW02_17695 [Comamonadaceae bacterium CG12_big_fil_rev_8_21_14_0_65_59_15]
MVTHTAKKVHILGITHNGRVFRPSDWAERLAGVMSQFRPGSSRASSHISYSPWCVPGTLNGAKCVIVSPALREHNVMAWDFCMNFAHDNELQVQEHTVATAANVVSLRPSTHTQHPHAQTTVRAAQQGTPVAAMPLRAVVG